MNTNADYVRDELIEGMDLITQGVARLLDAKDKRIAELDERLEYVTRQLSFQKPLIKTQENRIAQMEADLATANATIAQLQKEYGLPV